MDQLRVFVSHSSEDKLYVESLVQIIGKNGLTVDKYCFETGERTIDEIVRAIDNSGIFVLLMSKSALDKPWVKKEIALIKKHIDSGKLKKFKPFIIDESIDYKYDKIPEWIKDEYNLRTIYLKPPFLARRIEETIDSLRWEQHPEIERNAKTFVGRDADIEKLRKIYLEKNLKQRKAVIVSGIPDGIGRRRLLTEFIRKIEPNKSESYQPFSIDLNKDNSIEDVLLRLNQLFLFESNESITKFAAISNKDEKIKKAIEYISYIADKQEKLFIRDNGACVLRDGTLSSWFSELVKNDSIDHTVFFIASRNRFTRRYEYPEIVSLEIEPLTIDNAKTLLRQYIDNKGKDINEDDVNYFIKRTGRMPRLIAKCADMIADIGPFLAKQQQKFYIYNGDELTKNLISDFQGKKQHLQILILLSEFDYLTYGNIKQISNGIIDNIDEILSELYSLSIYETFGSNNEYIRMNPILADVISRSKHRLNDDLWEGLQERAHDIVEKETFEEANLGILLKKIESEIKGNTRNLTKIHIIPSIALKTINDEYRRKTKSGYLNVVDLCSKILENNKNYYAEINNRIHYLLCAAYAQLADDNFFSYRKYLNDYESTFLTGIYFRKKKNYSSAEKHFRRAVDMNPESLSAQNELAISLQRQDKYLDALKISEYTYGKQPSNPYYIVTYFKSLVRVCPNEHNLLLSLIEELHSTWDVNKETFSEMLEAEYAYFIQNDFEKAYAIYLAALDSNPLFPVFKSLHEVCVKERKKNLAEDIAIKYHFDFYAIDFSDI